MSVTRRTGERHWSDASGSDVMGYPGASPRAVASSDESRKCRRGMSLTMTPGPKATDVPEGVGCSGDFAMPTS